MHDVHDVAAAIIGELGPMDAMKLQKLVYYSQAWHLAIYNRVLFADAVEAWAAGPVVRELYNHHRGRRRVGVWQGSPENIEDASSQVVSLVCRKYGSLSGDELSTLTHQELPWKIARGGLPADARGDTSIDPADMATFYRSQELGTRLAADLAVGGVYLIANERMEFVDSMMLELRKEAFAGAPAAEHPAPGGNSSRSGLPVEQADAQPASRVRPARL